MTDHQPEQPPLRLGTIDHHPLCGREQMKPTDLCAHENFSCRVEVARIVDTEPVTFYADVTIRCDQCGLPFHFMGVKDFGLSPHHPCANPDSTELRCPIAPGPGEFIAQRHVFTVS